MMILLIQFNSSGPLVGPFNIYSNVDGYISPFAMDITKEQLDNGIMFEVPDGTTTIRIMSTGICYAFQDIVIDGVIITTTTTTESPSDSYYYGTLQEVGGFPTIPVDTDIDVESGTYVASGASGPIVIPYNSNIDDFLWFAIPVSAGTKTDWYVLDLNKGKIGGPANRFGNLFSDPYIVNVGGINHYLYISTVRTNLTSITIN